MLVQDGGGGAGDGLNGSNVGDRSGLVLAANDVFLRLGDALIAKAILAVVAGAEVGAGDAGLETLAIVLQAARFPAITSLEVLSLGSIGVLADEVV